MKPPREMTTEELAKEFLSLRRFGFGLMVGYHLLIGWCGVWFWIAMAQRKWIFVAIQAICGVWNVLQLLRMVESLFSERSRFIAAEARKILEEAR